MNGTNPKTESKVLSSFLLLLIALVATFVVLVMYAPNQRVSSRRDPFAEAREAVPVTSEQPKPPKPAQTVRAVAADRPSQPYGDEGSGGTGGGQVGESQYGAKAQSDKDLEDLLAQAMNLVDTGNPQAAMAMLDKILTKDSSNELALVEMGMIHLIDMKDPNSALGYLERALRVNPGNKVVLSELVGIYDELGQAEVGLNFMQSLYDEHPDNGSLAVGIGQVLAGQGRLQEAVPYLEKAAEDGRSDLALTDLADAYSQTGQSGKALETYRKVAEGAEEKMDSGFYANDPEMGKEATARAYMDVIGELVNQNREQEARDLMEKKVKHLFNGDLSEFASIFGASKGGHSPAPTMQ